MITQEIRRKFLKYFKENGHSVIPSSPVVPHDDPTLLFTNAGMNQFKDVFLGKSHRDYKRAATSQKCIRAGGKHNDLENVGHTSRHLTFFEMLGNFSFGDYFKKDAIKFAWEVSTHVFGFEPDRIWPTVFKDDDEAFELWTQYVPAKRITRFGEKENFWSMGDTGPCGPCSELLFDRGTDYGNARSPLEDTDGERYLEFWNLVFMQYNRTAGGLLEPLPKPSIDTGAGLERVVSLKMQVSTLFETDVFMNLIKQVELVSKVKYDLNDHAKAPAFRVIADHLRCLAFAIADGAQPSNVERGYVLRKVLRRAVRYGRTLGFEEPFLARVLPKLVEIMGADYPELIKSQSRIAEILNTEEEAFIRTLKRGGNILNQVIEQAKQHGKQISGEDAFKLKDTYGLPFEEILLLAKDADLSVDSSKYEKLEQEARERSKGAQKTTQQVTTPSVFSDFAKKQTTQFVGYNEMQTVATVEAILSNNSFVDQLNEGEEGLVILNKTPFYAEMGGQVGDIGTLSSQSAHFQVLDTKAPYKGIIGHVGKLTKGSIRKGERVTAQVDLARRQKIANNHTATHLLHWALHHVLGEHAKQGGSVVEPGRLRFDFSHHKPLTSEELRRIEDLVNAKIREDLQVKSYEIPYEEAQKKPDIKQFFGEKYDSKVRVIDIEFSKELCGGTHVRSLGTIGLFRIAKEGSIAAGVRRIEAVTGEDAEAFTRQSEDFISALSALLKIPNTKLYERIEKLLEENKQLSQQLQAFRQNERAQLVDRLLSQIVQIKNMPVIVSEVKISPEELRAMAEELSAKMNSGIIVLGSATDDKCQVIVRVSDDLVQKGMNAQNLAKALSPIIEGSGGGKQNFAQAGGKAPHKLAEALATVKNML